MAIVDDYDAISSEVRRIQAERSPQEKPTDDARSEPAWQHPMRSTIAGDMLYRRLVSQQARRQKRSSGTEETVARLGLLSIAVAGLILFSSAEAGAQGKS